MNINNVQGNWLTIVPMFNLEVSDNAPINGQWQVGDVTFVSKAKLETILTAPTIPTTPSPQLFGQITERDNSFAVIPTSGTPAEIRKSLFFRIRQAANILASTDAFYGKRHHVTGFTLKGYPFLAAKFDYFFQTDGPAWGGNWNQRGSLHPFQLDSAWHDAITQSGIIDLFARIRDNSIDPTWRRQIGSGAAMLGRSLMSLDLADAFLFNVIGLETLLTTYRERNGRMLAKRIKGMTGWHLATHRPTYQTEIEDIHKVRCEIVHDSDYTRLTNEMLLLSDSYLANSLLNIVRFPAIFPDKATLMAKLDDFADNENWPTDGSIQFRWFGNPTFAVADLDLPLF